MIKSALSLIIKSNITALKFSNKKMFSYALNNNKKYFFANEKKTDIKTPDAKAEAAPL
jgi:methionine salvage enolase-phosphatase E1